MSPFCYPAVLLASSPCYPHVPFLLSLAGRNKAQRDINKAQQNRSTSERFMNKPEQPASETTTPTAWMGVVQYRAACGSIRPGRRVPVILGTPLRYH